MSSGTNASSASAVASFWDVTNSHHVLPVFASGMAFTPSTFDSVICQSFYNAIIPAICEAVVCGQGSKTIFSIATPPNYIGRAYLDIFRVFNSRNVLCLGIYRAASDKNMAVLPYVYACPLLTSILHKGDRLLLLANQKTLQRTLISMELPFVPGNVPDTWFVGNLPF